MFGRLAPHEHGTGDVGGEDRFEARAVRIDQALEGAEPRVVDQDVEVSKGLENLPIGPGDIRLIGHIGADRESL